MAPSLGDSVVGNMTSNLIAAIIVCKKDNRIREEMMVSYNLAEQHFFLTVWPILAVAEPSAVGTVPRTRMVGRDSSRDLESGRRD